MMEQAILDGYSRDAKELIVRFEALSTSDILSPVRGLLPKRPSRILEVGAGTGRDAAWFAAQGHSVVAVEPVPELRSAGAKLHPSERIVWIDDRLPHLDSATLGGEPFDLIVAIAVWQHLPGERHAQALQTLARLLAPGGRLIISVRLGPGSPTRPCFPCNVEQMIVWATFVGLGLVAQVSAPSVQQKNRDAGVSWTWLCFDRIGADLRQAE